MIRKTICVLILFSIFYLQFPNISFALDLTSTENVSVSATVLGTTPMPTPSGGGSGSAGVINIPKTSARFSGEAYPDATITLLKNGVVSSVVKADNDGLFSLTLEEQYQSTTLYTLYARDVAGNKSPLLNYPLVVSEGYLTHLSGIRFPPTVTIDKIQIKKGDYLSVGGYSLPRKLLEIVVENQSIKSERKVFTLTSRDTGLYNLTFPLGDLPKGEYFLYVKYPADTRISKFVRFIIGDSNIKSANSSLNIPGDCNADGVINLVDFSVLAFWYKKNHPPKCVDTNEDKMVDLTDFSILAYYWSN